MIEPTVGMVNAFFDALPALRATPDVRADVRAGLAAVLALVERDYDVRPARQSLPPCGAEGPDGLRCERNPHTPDRSHGALVDDGLVRW